MGFGAKEDSEGNFEMVGSYSKGKSWDMFYGVEGDEKKIRHQRPGMVCEGPALRGFWASLRSLKLI
jgi:uncharacterized protein YjlB